MRSDHHWRLCRRALTGLVACVSVALSSLGVVVVSTLGIAGPSSAAIANGADAIDQIGQYDNDDLTALVPHYTKPIQQFAANSLTRAGLENPSGLALDATHHRLFVADASNKRVLVHALNVDNTLPDMVPDFVLGQPNFNTEVAAVSASGLTAPVGLAYDAFGDRLFVADSTAHRVVVYDVAAIANGEAAVHVLGQGTFGGSASAFTATGLSTPLGLAFDSVGSRLFVADSGNHRVIVYNVGDVVDGESAVSVLGQLNFTDHAAATTAAGMNAPSGVLYDGANTRLYVMDRANNRVTAYAVASITDGQAATNVIGQPDFSTPTAGTTSQKLSAPRAAALDAATSRLFVADSANHRVLAFDVAALADNPVAVSVLGQPDFATATGATTQAGLRTPFALAFDADSDLLFVADRDNHRVIVSDVASITDGEGAVNELGQVDANNPDPLAFDPIFTKGDTNANPTRVTLKGDSSVTFDYVRHRLFVCDRFNGRLLVFNLDANNRLVDKVPDFVLGQPDFNGISTVAVPTATSLSGGPMGAAYDPQTDRLFVADVGNRRVLVFDVSTITNGEPAIHVLGQPGFVTNALQLTQSGFTEPVTPFFDAVEGHLYVTDRSHNRVLVFDVDDITDGEPAVNVIGQTDFVTGTAHLTQNGLTAPLYTVIDAHRRLFVADSLSHRVLVFDATALADGEPAVNVIGQPDFVTGANDLNAKGFLFLFGLDYDVAGERLFAGDFFNNRVLVFDAASVADNEDAVHVLGQADFTSNVSAVSRSTLLPVTGSTFNASTQELYVSDPRSNRIMIFDAAAATGGGRSCPAHVVTLTTPNGGETVAAGETRQLTFGINGCDVQGIAASLVVDGAATPLALSGVAFDASRGQASWQVPNLPTTHARLRVELLGAVGQVLASDQSDADFIIAATPPAVSTGSSGSSGAAGSGTPPPAPAAPTVPLVTATHTAREAYLRDLVPLTINENLGFTAATPQVVPPRCISGTLIKSKGRSTVYYCAADARRYAFANPKVFRSWYPSFDAVIVMGDETLASIPIGGYVTYRPKQRLVKFRTDPKVYAVGRAGVLHWVTEDVARVLHGSSWTSFVDDIPDIFLLNYRIGDKLE
jgi:sugar lactone lactonase YvrE